ncbi:MAG: hypothetical protein WC848_00125 [Parcubacteria group bacterium]|jgi:hypothetical protein
MIRNKEILLVGTFFLVIIFFGAIFWHILGSGDSEAFDQIRKNAEIVPIKKTTVATPATTAPATAATSGVPPVPATSPIGSETTMPSEMQNTTPEIPDPSVKKNDDPIDPTSRKTPDDMADWKVYEEAENIFEFKYPADAQVVPSGDLIRVSQNDKTWKFRVFDNKDKTDLQAWYNAEFSEKERTNCTMTDSTLKVASYEMKYVNPNSGTIACGKAGYFAISTDKKNVLRVELGEETVENANKILATFKFEE